MAKALSVSILSTLLVLTVGGMGGAVRAENTCLPAPTGKTPPGSHWHYRTDPVKQTKCWYLSSQGDAAQPAATGDGADAAGAAPAAPAPKPAKPHQGAKPPGGARPSATGAQAPAPGQAGQFTPTEAPSSMQAAPANAPPAVQGAAPWPDPQPQSATGGGGVAWPTPPALAPSEATNAAADTGGTNAAAESPTTGQDTGSINATGAGEAPAPEGSPPTPAQTSDVSGSTILALAVAMAIVGVLMRWLLGKLFARRRKLAAERHEPVWVTDEYVMPDALTRGARRPPGRVDPDRLDDEAKQALRKLLRTLERSAA